MEALNIDVYSDYSGLTCGPQWWAIHSHGLKETGRHKNGQPSKAQRLSLAMHT